MIKASGQSARVSTSAIMKRLPTPVVTAHRIRIFRADQLGGKSERNLKRHVAGDEDGQQRGDASPTEAICRAINGHQRQYHLLECRGDDHGEKQNRGQRQKRPKRCAMFVEIESWKTGQHHGEARATDNESADADQERRPAVRADESEGERPDREAAGYDHRVKPKKSAAAARRRERQHPNFAQHIKRVDHRAEQEAKREPGVGIAGPCDENE